MGEYLVDGADFAHHLHLRVHVCERETAGHETLSEPNRLFLIEVFGSKIDQALDIAHAEKSRDEAVRFELLEVLNAFPITDEYDGCASCCDRAECTSSTGCSVEFGDDRARDSDEVVESLGDRAGCLADLCIDDEEALGRVGDFGYA